MTILRPSCPECGGLMVETFTPSGGCAYFCTRAIGAVLWNQSMPEGDPHKGVRAWSERQLRRKYVRWLPYEETGRAVDDKAHRRAGRVA